MALITIGSNGLGAGVGGKVLQTQQVVKTDSWTSVNPSYVDITGLSLNITPSSSSNKILLFVSMGIVANSGANGSMIRLLKDGSYLVRATTSGNAQSYEAFMVGGGSVASDANRHKHSHTLTYLDTPSTTSQINYKVQGTIDGGSTTIYVNRWGNDGNHASVSSITAMEISA